MLEKILGIIVDKDFKASKLAGIRKLILKHVKCCRFKRKTEMSNYWEKNLIQSS